MVLEKETVNLVPFLLQRIQKNMNIRKITTILLLASLLVTCSTPPDHATDKEEIKLTSPDSTKPDTASAVDKIEKPLQFTSNNCHLDTILLQKEDRLNDLARKYYGEWHMYNCISIYNSISANNLPFKTKIYAPSIRCVFKTYNHPELDSTMAILDTIVMSLKKLQENMLQITKETDRKQHLNAEIELELRLNKDRIQKMKDRLTYSSTTTLNTTEQAIKQLTYAQDEIDYILTDKVHKYTLKNTSMVFQRFARFIDQMHKEIKKK